MDNTLYGTTGIREAFEAGYGQSGPDKEVAYQEFLKNNPKLQSRRLDAKETVEILTDYFNSYGSKESDFIEAIAREHRTLQQSFTKAALMWIEHIASPEYRTDGRNEGSQKTAQKLMKGWKLLGESNHSETYGMLPSQWIPFV